MSPAKATATSRPTAAKAAATKPAGLDIAPSIPLELVEWKMDSDPQLRNGVNMCRFVPYIDGRDVARLFDEWVGPINWSDGQHGGGYDEGQVAGEHGMWCSIAVRPPGSDEWLVKSDFGRPSSYEKGKGLVSDAFKRCAIIKWGVGRNVYDLPNVTAPVNVWTPKGTDRDGKPKKTKAFTNDQTLPHILAELQRMGFEDVKGGRVERHDEIDHQQEVEDDTSPQADQPPAARSTRAAAKKATASRVPDDGGGDKVVPTGSVTSMRAEMAKRLEAARPATKIAFAKAFGEPSAVRPRDMPKAFELLWAGTMRPADTEAAGDAVDDVAEAMAEDATTTRHTGLLREWAKNLSNEQLEVEITGLVEIGVIAEGPIERKDAELALVSHFLGVLAESYPAGVTDEEWTAWLELPAT